MSFYLTPTKPQQKKNGQTYSQDKPTDWICMVCNNLNFSFRKKCNRCKMQTRIQNENQLATAYSEYYLNSMTYLTVPKNPLADLTNCNTPEPRSKKTETSKTDRGSTIISQPIDFRESILDVECWEKIKDEVVDGEEKDTRCEEWKRKQQQRKQQREPSICQFTDLEIEFLVNQVLEQSY